MEPTIIEYNVCSVCLFCGGTSITVRRGNSGLRVWGNVKLSRTVKTLNDLKDPLLLKGLRSLKSLSDKHYQVAKDYLVGGLSPEIRAAYESL